MKVTIRTEWPEVVKRTLFDLSLLQFPDVTYVDGSMVTIEQTGDDLYREMRAWLAGALACGLIMRGEIER